MVGFGCLGFTVLCIIVLVGVVAVAGRVSVGDEAVLKMALSGPVPERATRNAVLDLLAPNSGPLSVLDHLNNLKKAAADKHIRGVVLTLDAPHVGWAKVEELRDGLVEFKKSGKFVIAYAEQLEERTYALAVAADEVVMPAHAPFEFNGLAADIAHYPGLLEKAGIEVQYFRYGKYKSVSGEQYGRKAFTEPVKEMINSNLDLTFEHFLEAVAHFRSLAPDQVRALIEEGKLTSNWAAENKLIDRLAYFDEVEEEVRSRLGVPAQRPVRWVSGHAYRDVSAAQAGLEEGGDLIALIYSQGLIVSGQGQDGDPLGGEATQGSAPIIAALRRAVKDDRVKAILLRVDSPGGAGLGCDYVRREVERARAKKPVIVSMSDVAASGGYWISMSASAIVAQPTTATGSIGIFSVVPNLAGLYEKLSLNNEVFRRGGHADAIIGARALTATEAQSFDSELRASYDFFVDLAAKGRGKTSQDMEPLAQGRTWYGSQALERGLVDRLGGFPAAVALAKEKAGLASDRAVKLELFERQRGLFEELLGGGDEEEESDVSTRSGSVAATVLAGALEVSWYRALLPKTPQAMTLVRLLLERRTRVFPLMEYQVDYR